MRNVSRGYSIVELIVSMAILCIVMPIIYSALINTQKIFYSSAAENEMESESRRTLEFIKSDIRQSRAIFDINNKGVSDFFNSVTDSINGTTLTSNEKKEASSLLLMKYTGDLEKEFSTGSKKLNQYKLVYYYMKNSDKKEGGIDSRIIIRAESENIFLDTSPLNSDESTVLKSEGYLTWFPQKSGYRPELPLTESIEMQKRKLSLYTAPGGIKIRDSVVPEPGGLLLKLDGNRVLINLFSARSTSNGIKKYAISTEVVARGYLMK